MKNAVTKRPGKPSTIPGRRLWSVGGFVGDWTSDVNTHEVMIPPGKCVYFWLGCKYPRYRRNRCSKHYKEELALGEFGEPSPAPLPLCKCRKRNVTSTRSNLCKVCRDHEHAIAYYAEHTDEIKAKAVKWRQEHREEDNKRKALWRQNNRERIRAYDNAWGKARREATA